MFRDQKVALAMLGEGQNFISIGFSIYNLFQQNSAPGVQGIQGLRGLAGRVGPIGKNGAPGERGIAGSV